MSLKNNLKILRVKAMMPINLMYMQKDNEYVQMSIKEHKAIIYYIIDHYSKDDFIYYDDLFNIIISFKNYVAKNRGYDSTNFKTLITVANKKENTESKYYVVAVNEFKEWNIDILESKPDNW